MKSVYVLIGFGFGLLVMSIPMRCQKQQIKKTQVETVTEPIEPKLPNLTYNDSTGSKRIARAKQRIRGVVDSSKRWIYDSTWIDFCRCYSDSGTISGCQRQMVAKLLENRFQHELIGEYQNKWEKDSLWIQEALKLDSIKTDRISNLIKKNDQLSTKKQRTKRLAKIGHFAAGLVGAIMIIK
jgi:hypothetical protein